MNHGQVSVYPGTYDEYVWSLEKGVLSTRGAENLEALPEKKAAVAPSTDQMREKKRNLEKKIKQAEKNLEVLDKNLLNHQEKLSLLNEQIANRTTGNFPQAIRDLTEVQQKIEKFEEEWLALTENRDRCMEELSLLKG